MEKKIKVKPEYSDRIYGFNNSTAPLGQRDDLHILLKAAKYHKLKDIIDMFEEVTEEEIKEQQGKAFEDKQKEKDKEKTDAGKTKTTGGN